MPRPSLSHTAKMPFPTGKGITKQAQVGIPLHYTSQVFRQPCNFATPVAGRRMYQQAGLLAQASSPLLRLPVCNHSGMQEAGSVITAAVPRGSFTQLPYSRQGLPWRTG